MAHLLIHTNYGGHGLTSCPRCHGRGYIYGTASTVRYECEHCGGEGVIEWHLANRRRLPPHTHSQPKSGTGD